MKKKKEINLKTWLIPKLRRLSFMWPPRNEAKKLARVERGKYKCNICQNIFGPKEVVLDHIIPVVNPEDGWQDFGVFIESLFCKVEGFQTICIKCHDIKTENENKIRKEVKKS